MSKIDTTFYKLLEHTNEEINRKATRKRKRKNFFKGLFWWAVKLAILAILIYTCIVFFNKNKSIEISASTVISNQNYLTTEKEIENWKKDSDNDYALIKGELIPNKEIVFAGVKCYKADKRRGGSTYFNTIEETDNFELLGITINSRFIDYNKLNSLKYDKLINQITTESLYKISETDTTDIIQYRIFESNQEVFAFITKIGELNDIKVLELSTKEITNTENLNINNDVAFGLMLIALIAYGAYLVVCIISKILD